jgi:hypothetical protein
MWTGIADGVQRMGTASTYQALHSESPVSGERGYSLGLRLRFIARAGRNGSIGEGEEDFDDGCLGD